MIASILGYSGGKDSTAAGLHLVEMGVELNAVFADTGNESEKTIDYIQYINDQVFPVKTIRADFSEQIANKRKYVSEKWHEKGVPDWIVRNALDVLKPTGIPFLDLCLLKGRFPSTKAKFCTTELKVFPTYEQIIDPALEAGYIVHNYTGVRRDESKARADTPLEIVKQEDSSGHPILIIKNPLAEWTVDHVFTLHKKHGVKPNPLYMEDASRVGCFPCIMSRKGEIRMIHSRYPHHIERIREWERLVALASKRQDATMFSPNKIPGNSINHIAQVVEWSKTARGGRQFGIFEAKEDTSSCSSIYGLCE